MDSSVYVNVRLGPADNSRILLEKILAWCGERWTEGIVFRISLGKYELSCTERGYHQGINNSRHIRINML